MSNKSTKIERLRLKRATFLERQSNTRLRDTYGPRLADIVSMGIGKPVSLSDFHVSLAAPLSLKWPEDLARAPGLVAAYISRDSVSRLLSCFQMKLDSISGMLGFHDKQFLGLTELREVDPFALLRISELADDSVLFYVANPMGVIMVDCYSAQPGESFSVLVQGDELVPCLATCFDQTC